MAASERAQVQLVLKLFGSSGSGCAQARQVRRFRLQNWRSVVRGRRRLAVNLRYRVGVVPEGGGSAAAMAKACGGIAKVEPGCEQLAAV